MLTAHRMNLKPPIYSECKHAFPSAIAKDINTCAINRPDQVNMAPKYVYFILQFIKYSRPRFLSFFVSCLIYITCGQNVPTNWNEKKNILVKV